jgi:hypothetical protein
MQCVGKSTGHQPRHGSRTLQETTWDWKRRGRTSFDEVQSKAVRDRSHQRAGSGAKGAICSRRLPVSFSQYNFRPAKTLEYSDECEWLEEYAKDQHYFT